MSSIFREVVMQWDGKEYRLKPTMALLNRIEQDVSISMVAYKITNGNPPLSQMATIAAHFLQAAGAKVTAEDVYLDIMNGDQASVSSLAESILLAAFPQVGKAEAPPTKKGRSAK